MKNPSIPLEQWSALKHSEGIFVSTIKHTWTTKETSVKEPCYLLLVWECYILSPSVQSLWISRTQKAMHNFLAIYEWVLAAVFESNQKLKAVHHRC